MRIRFLVLFLCGLGTLCHANGGFGDEPLKLYVNPYDVDLDYLRQEITYVNHVRFPQEADVHILVTAQRTGGRGTEYTLTFVGQNRFAGIHDTLAFVANLFDTQEIVRREMVRVVKLGLMPYVKQLPVASDLVISYKASSRNGKPQEVQDKWKNWVFSIGFNTNIEGEESNRSVDLWNSLNARRVTADWKVFFSLNNSYEEEWFDYEDAQVTSISRERAFDFSVIRSLGGHWSAGVWTGVSSSTYHNIKSRVYMEPQVEYNILPYSESTRHELRIVYGITARRNVYYNETVYLKTDELLYSESLGLHAEAVRTWGSIHSHLTGQNYLHDFQKNSLRFSTNISLKLVKGLSLSLWGNVSRVHDQISLPREGATLEEVLLRQKILRTQYYYSTHIGLSYSFGSMYNNIVNPRFGGGN